MDNHEINPDSTILRQSDGQWQKYFALVIHKLAREGVTISMKDVESFTAAPRNVLLTHGHADSVEFKLVTMEEAHVLAEHESTQSGRA